MVIRFQYIFMSALTTSMFLNTSHTLYHTVLQMSLFLLTNTDVNTVTDCLQSFLHQETRNFHQTKAQRPLFVNKGSSDSCFSWMWGPSRNRDELNEHELSWGPSSANTHQTQYISWPIRNELKPSTGHNIADCLCPAEQEKSQWQMSSWFGH